jgi:hypothetical protein
MFGIDDLIILLLFGLSAGGTAKYLCGDEKSSYNDYEADRLNLPSFSRQRHDNGRFPRVYENEDRSYLGSQQRRNNVSTGAGRHRYIFDRETGQLQYEEED